MELLISLLVFVVVLAIVAYIIQNFIFPSISDSRLRTLIMLVVGIVALLILLRYVLHLI